MGQVSQEAIDSNPNQDICGLERMIASQREPETVWNASPFPKPVTTSFQASKSPEVTIVVVRNEILIPKGIHHHDEYEFFVPLTPILEAKTERAIVETRQNIIMPFNSGQGHGCPRVMPGRFLCIMIPSKFMEETAGSAFGKKKVVFRNEAIPYSLMLQRLLSYFIEEAQSQSLGYNVALQGLSLQICVDLLRRGKTNLLSSLPSKNLSEDQGLSRAIDLMMSGTSNLSLDDMARAANLSRFHFIRVFKQATGKTPWEYLMGLRIEKACSLLKRNALTVSDIALECGFDSPSYFSTVFKRTMGLSPSEYRMETNKD